MSIATEILRLRAAKAALKAAINAKGGTITEEQIDAFAAQVAAISTGLDTSGFTAEVADVLDGKTFGSNAETKETGTMPDKADNDVEVEDLDGTLIPAGYYNGSGAAKLSVAEAAKVISANIKGGVTLLGVSGDGDVVKLPELTTPATAADIGYGKEVINGSGEKITGLGGYWQYAARINFTESPVDVAMTIYAPLAKLFTYNFYNCQNLPELNITVNEAPESNCEGLFQRCFALTAINTAVPIDMTAVTNVTNMFAQDYLLESFRFKANTLKYSLSLADSPNLDAATRLNLANSMDAANPATLTVHATAYAAFGTDTVDNASGVAVPGSAMTLAAFIANIKGWTLMGV